MLLKNTIRGPIEWQRDRTSFNHAQEITKPFGEVEHVLDWCKSELVDEWRWQLVDVSSNHRPGRYIFYFDNEKDYLAFVMKWS
jgi:hypothetical protein